MALETEGPASKGNSSQCRANFCRSCSFAFSLERLALVLAPISWRGLLTILSCKEAKLESSIPPRDIQETGFKPAASTPDTKASAETATATPATPTDALKKSIADPTSHSPGEPIDQNPSKAEAEPAAPVSAMPTAQGSADRPSDVEQQAKAAVMKKQKPKAAAKPDEDLFKSWQQIQDPAQ